MIITRNLASQYPSTLALRHMEDDNFLLSGLPIYSIEKLEEQAWRGRCSVGTPPDLADHLGDETDGLATTDAAEGEKLNLGGAWHMIPLRLGDLDISFAGSCSGNLQEYFKSCTVSRCSTMVLMVGLSDGSLWRHLCAMSATVLVPLWEEIDL